MMAAHYGVGVLLGTAASTTRVSRQDLFAGIERPVLQPLPETDYEFAEWRLARPGHFPQFPQRLCQEV